MGKGHKRAERPERRIMKKNMERHYRIDEVTAERIKERARSLSINESEYVRRLIMSDLSPVDPKAMKEIVRHIAAIGNNINQIAHVANMMLFDRCDLERIDEFRMELIELKKEILRMMKRMEGGDG